MCFPSGEVSIPDAVLIDTWWNVNTAPITVHTNCFIVLIDTWWNVNADSFLLPSLS